MCINKIYNVNYVKELKEKGKTPQEWYKKLNKVEVKEMG